MKMTDEEMLKHATWFDFGAASVHRGDDLSTAAGRYFIRGHSDFLGYGIWYSPESKFLPSNMVNDGRFLYDTAREACEVAAGFRARHMIHAGHNSRGEAGSCEKCAAIHPELQQDQNSKVKCPKCEHVQYPAEAGCEMCTAPLATLEVGRIIR